MAHASHGASTRKVVTVLFTDITGSTALGESLDPEPLERILSRYFAEMQAVIERHGGLVTKFIGDAVMAIFGLPASHEDDALRAVRAAVDMRARLEALNEEFESSLGITVAVRTGVNTGEVLAAEPATTQSLVVGDTVNTAARLEQNAAPGEILIGRDTHRLVHEAVTAEPIGPLTVKGKAAPLPAWRLLEVIPDAPGWGRRLDARLVGRDRELALLVDAFQRVEAGPACEMVTVMGPAGLGKSRLTAELVTRVQDRATVLHGRCLPYGEGITFWPIAAVVMAAMGVHESSSQAQARDKLADLLRSAGGGDAGEDELIADGLAPLLGMRATNAGVRETSWAVRAFLERLARTRPLVIVLDDIHWGEPTFLDLVDYLSDWIVGVPVLILCQARPELLEVRPLWATPKPNASIVSLTPLTEQETDGLIRGLVGADVPPAARTRIAEATEGNPLFIEETIRMLVDDGVLRRRDSRWAVAGNLATIAIPPTIHALLSARLDRLDPEQRMVTERAAVVGRSFWWGAVSELSPEKLRPRVGASLQSLVRKELIRPDRSDIRGEDAFRFTHILVRDAAYNGIPKATRAEMHERLAGWITVNTRDVAGEYEEIVGYHLEQAHRSLLELGFPAERTAPLGESAANGLASAGERAFARGDMPAAVNLLLRATALLPPQHARRLELLPEAAFALLEAGDFERLVAIADEMEETASHAEDVRLKAHATIIGLWIRLFTEPQSWAGEAERAADDAIATFARLGDERGLARAWSLLGLVGMLSSRLASAEQAWSRAVEHAERAGTRREAVEGLAWVAAAVWVGPTPAREGIRRCVEVRDRAQGDRKAMSTALFSQGGLEANLGRFAEARALFGRSRALLEEVALPMWLAGGHAQAEGWALLLEGRAAAAEQMLRRSCDTLTAIGEANFLSTVAGILAEAIFVQGRHEEAYRFTEVSEESAGVDDVYSQLLWRSVRAKCLGRQGDTGAALRIAGECDDLLAATDALDLRRHVRMCQAEVLAGAGRAADAERAIRAAIRDAEAKENVVGAQAGRDALR